MAKFNPKTKRYHGDKGKMVSRDTAFKPVTDFAEQMGEAGEQLGDKFAKETTELADQLGAEIDKKIEAIEQSNEAIDNVSEKVFERIQETVNSTAKNRMTAMLLAKSKEISSTSASQQEADQKKQDILKDIRRAASPETFRAIEKLEEKKAQGGIGGKIAGAMGSMLQKYEAHQLKKEGYNELAAKVSERVDEGVQKPQVAPAKQMTNEERMIALLEKIEQNTAEGGTGKNESYEPEKQKSKSLLGNMMDKFGGVAGMAKTGFIANMLGDHQSRDAMLISGLALAGGKAVGGKIGNMFTSSKPASKKEPAQTSDGFEEKDDSSFSERMKGIYEGEPKEAKTGEKEDKKSSLMEMIMSGAKALFSSIGGLLGSLKTGLMGIVTAVMAKLAIGGGAAGAVGKAAGLAGGAAKMLGGAALVGAAGYAGYKAGEWLNENTGIQEGIASGIDTVKGWFGNSDADKAAAVEKQSELALYEKKKAAGEPISKQLAERLEKQGVKVEASMIRGQAQPAKKQTGTTVERSTQAAAQADVRKEDNKHAAVINASKNITVSQPASPPSTAAPRVRHDESSLRIYIGSRMKMA